MHWRLLIAAALLLAHCGGGAASRPAPSALALAPELLPAAASPPLATDRVRVEFYGEALCPYCIKFTLEQLSSLFKNGLDRITELEYIPSGNARLGDDGTITCQHGPKVGGRVLFNLAAPWIPASEAADSNCSSGSRDIELNRVLSCALAFAPNQYDWFPFVECLEGQADKLEDDELDVAALTTQCAVHAGILPSRVLACANGTLGDYLERHALERTASLVPPHRWVPWVVVNGVPLLDDFENVATFVCAAYGGYPKPKYCFHDPPPDPSAAAAAAAAVSLAGDAPAAARAPARAEAGPLARAAAWLLGGGGGGGGGQAGVVAA
ncbi:hypothetical protein Rsub_06205 [Raphidocelis subcapitata]|uniref:Gamma-interferon-inducible lysosomal thiol reductase n=1 Tax=Raphidocelis subcapitata TaxID=307507 RepID=A0A2V0P258_9CHLO|nr:hypothetical protein Rsub_06205 [Raphidocelis subcapitata]|eukprot:GBF93956.1 hypothetical protein Rsub_06205 [Raphidocelis subcapitata]